jgi:hypothetical protein
MIEIASHILSQVNMRFRQSFAFAVVFATLPSCASAPAVKQEPQSDADRVASVLAGANRWTGTLNPTQGHTSAAVTTTRQRAYGTVELTATPNRPTVTHVRLNVTVPMEPGLNNLGWGIHPGGCGSGTPPVMSPGAFPTIVLSTNGGGSVDDDIGFALPTMGSYHVNVFRGNGTQLSDVITCANLRRDT